MDEMIAFYRRFEDAEAEFRQLVKKTTRYPEADDLPGALQVLAQALALADTADVTPALRMMALAMSASWHIELGQVARARPCIDRMNGIAFSSSLPQWLRLHAGVVCAELGIATGDAAVAVPPLLEALAAIGRGELLSMASQFFVVTARALLLLGEAPSPAGSAPHVAKADKAEAAIPARRRLLQWPEARGSTVPNTTAAGV